MFDKFGEFDSAEEINRVAAAQREEGDIEAIKLLAKENGIDEEDAVDFAEGVVEELTTTKMAAIGKLEVEAADLNITGVLMDWVNELKALCMKEEIFAVSVRRKGKELAGFIALTAETGYEHRAVVDKRIVEKAGKIKSIVGSHEFAIGIPNQAERKMLARKYYMEV